VTLKIYKAEVKDSFEAETETKANILALRPLWPSELNISALYAVNVPRPISKPQQDEGRGQKNEAQIEDKANCSRPRSGLISKIKL